MVNNFLYSCDNLFLLNGMNSASVDLIYLDPPFNSKRFYSAPVGSKSAGASFKDMWTWDDVNISYLEQLYTKHSAIVDCISFVNSTHSKEMGAYLTYMTQRLFEMYRVLKPTGSIYLHVDPTASHYLKIIMDGIFGNENFHNEIIWSYQRWTGATRHFQRMHDVILFYSKTQNHTFNVLTEPYSKKSQHKGKRFSTTEQGKVIKQDYIDNVRQKSMRDVWDISILNSQSKERTGYPTQKPLALLYRVIKASSNEGDVVFDPFCGCATACVAAQQLNRDWIGCDIEKKAADILVERLETDAGLFKNFVNTDAPPKRTDVDLENPSAKIKASLYQQQVGHCNGCYNEYLPKDLEIDHIIPRSKGGGNYRENYQLLCGNCNRKKGANTMEYLIAKLEKVRENRIHVKYQ